LVPKNVGLRLITLVACAHRKEWRSLVVTVRPYPIPAQATGLIVTPRLRL